MATRKRGPGKRYTSAERKRILSAAAKDGLTGEQVAKRFGVAALTFYRWRGPVRGPKARIAGTATKVKIAEGNLRGEVRARIAQMLPEIIRQEVAEAVAALLGIRRPGRPRRSAA